MSSTPSSSVREQIAKCARGATSAMQLVDVPLVHRGHGDDLLRQHVERVARGTRICSIAPVAHALARRPRTRAGRRGTWGRSCRCTARRRGGRRGRPAAGRARPNPATRPAPRGRPRPCRCPARATEVATSAGSRPGLELVLDLQPLLAGERAVVRARAMLLARPSSLSRCREPLGRAAGCCTKTIVERCARISSSSRG